MWGREFFYRMITKDREDDTNSFKKNARHNSQPKGKVSGKHYLCALNKKIDDCY